MPGLEGEELTALGRLVLGFLCMDSACGRAAAEHGHVKSKPCRHAKLYRTLVL